MNKVSKLIVMIMLLLASMLCMGCNANKKTEEKLRDLELTVVAEEKLPEELSQIIVQRKSEPFKFKFQDGDYMYICIGYGQQDTGGYSITVSDLYLTSNAVYVKTNLIGPGADVVADGVSSYPNIVIKTEALDYPVVFK